MLVNPRPIATAIMERAADQMGGTADDLASTVPMGRMGQAEEISPLVENLRLVLLENCGHYQAEEAPDQVIEELLRFFNEAM